MNAMVAFNLFQSRLVICQTEKSPLFYGRFQTYQHYAPNLAERSLDMFRSGFDSHLKLQNFEMNAMVAFNLFQSRLVICQTDKSPLFYGRFQTYQHYAPNLAERSLDMFRSEFDSHLKLQNFEMNAMVAFNLFQSRLVICQTEMSPLFYGRFQTYQHYAPNLAERSLDMFRSGFDSHLKLQNFEMNAMVAFNLFQSRLVICQTQKSPLFYGRFQTYQHYALNLAERSLDMFRSGFDSHLKLQNFEMNAMVAFNLFQSRLVICQTEKSPLFYGRFQTYQHYAPNLAERSFDMFRSGFDSHLTLQNFEMNAMVAFNLFQSRLVICQTEMSPLFYGRFQTYQHYAPNLAERSLDMFRSGFDSHLTLQNFEMNAMVAFNLFQSRLVICQTEKSPLFYGRFQTYQHYAPNLAERSFDMFRSGFDSHLTLQNFEMNAMVAFNLFQSRLVICQTEMSPLFYGRFQTYQHYAPNLAERSLDMFRSGFDSHLKLQNFEMNAMVAFNLFQSRLVICQTEMSPLFYGRFQTYQHYAPNLAERSLDMFRSGFDSHLKLQNFEMNAMVAFNLFQSRLVICQTQKSPLFYGRFQTYQHYALNLAERSLDMFRSGFDSHLKLQNFEMNAMVAFNLFQSRLVICQTEKSPLFYGRFQTYQHYAPNLAERSFDMFRSGFDSHLTLQNFEMNAMVAFNLFQSRLVICQTDKSPLFYGRFQTYQHYAPNLAERSLDMFRSGFDSHLKLQNFEMNAMVAFNLFQSRLVICQTDKSPLFYGRFQTYQHYAPNLAERSLDMFRSGFDSHLKLQNFEMNAMVAFNLFQSRLVICQTEMSPLFYGRFQTYQHYAPNLAERSLDMFRSGFDSHLKLQNFEMNAMVAFNLFQSRLVICQTEMSPLFYGRFQTYQH